MESLGSSLDHVFEARTPFPRSLQEDDELQIPWIHSIAEDRWLLEKEMSGYPFDATPKEKKQDPLGFRHASKSSGQIKYSNFEEGSYVFLCDLALRARLSALHEDKSAFATERLAILRDDIASCFEAQREAEQAELKRRDQAAKKEALERIRFTDPQRYHKEIIKQQVSNSIA
jgi:hypothetical protein